jgi:hypothetical protein
MSLVKETAGEADGLPRCALVAALGTVVAFGVAHLSSNVPGLRAILGTTSAGTRGPVSLERSVDGPDSPQRGARCPASA